MFIGVIAVSYFVIEKDRQEQAELEAAEPAELEVIKVVDPNCENCFKMSYLLNILREENVVFNKIEEVDVNSERGQELKTQYGIKKVPILIITGEVNKDEHFVNIWKGYGQHSEDIMVSNVFPPYKKLEDGEIIGLVEQTTIYDSTCEDCYSTNVHKQFLEADGIFPTTTTKLDVSEPEAQELIERYSITKIPTIILSSEAKYYKKFTEGWQADGQSIAFDGYYVFETPERLGTYKDLDKNEIITK